MKKRWIPLCAVLIAIVFLGGISTGLTSALNRSQRISEEAKKIQPIIAVVVNDKGVDVSRKTLQNDVLLHQQLNMESNSNLPEDRKFYSAAFLNLLDSSFQQVAYTLAEDGFTKGSYSAVVYFPYDFSEKIYSINDSQPEKIQLDFKVNPNLSESDYISTYLKVLGIQATLNDKIAYVYVATIMDEFHAAQGEIKNVFSNSESDINALAKFQKADFTDPLNWGEIPLVQLTPEDVDAQKYIEDLHRIADNMDYEYQESYKKAKADYSVMQEEMYETTKNIQEYSASWQEKLDEWKDISVRYGESLAVYSDNLDGKQSDLQNWRQDMMDWNEALTSYHNDLSQWNEDVMNWYNTTMGWFADLDAYKNNLDSYTVSISNYHTAASGQLERVIADLTSWKNALGEYASGIMEAPSIIREAITTYNNGVAYYNSYLSNLILWRNNINTILDGISTKISDIPERPNRDDYQNQHQYRDAMAAWAESLPDFTELHADMELLVEPPEDAPNLIDVGTLDLFTSPPNYVGVAIPDGFDDETPQMPSLPSLNAPDGYNGSEQPDVVGDSLPFEFETPENPLVGAPPVPVEMDLSISTLKETLASYDAESYLSDSVKAKISEIIGGYANHLEWVRDDLYQLYLSNVQMLESAYYEYDSYVQALYGDAKTSEKQEQEKIGEAKDAFFEARMQTHEQNLTMLSGFVGKLPRSASNGLLNQVLVSFTVSPVNFVTPEVRADIDSLSEDSVTPWMDLAILLAAIAGVIALGFGILVHLKKRKATE